MRDYDTLRRSPFAPAWVPFGGYLSGGFSCIGFLIPGSHFVGCLSARYADLLASFHELPSWRGSFVGGDLLRTASSLFGRNEFHISAIGLRYKCLVRGNRVGLGREHAFWNIDRASSVALIRPYRWVILDGHVLDSAALRRGQSLRRIAEFHDWVARLGRQHSSRCFTLLTSA